LNFGTKESNMKKYEVVTKSLVTRVYYVEAESEEEAIDKSNVTRPSSESEDDEEVVYVGVED
jgi:hypothetical protein